MKTILVLALLIACCIAQLTTNDINTILKLHNDARANPIPAPASPLLPLSWDANIAADAQNWVNQCQKNLSPKFYSTIYGENVIMMTPKLDIPSAYNLWFQKKSSFNFADGSCTSSSCASFQQIMSSQTTSIGCGVASCSFGVFFVCDYKNFAQYTGVIPYTPASSPPNSDSDSDFPTSGSVSSGFATSNSATSSATSGSAASSSATLGSASSSSGALSSTTSSASSGTNPTNGYARIDYRGTPAVLGVHDQKNCGDCWAFSTIAIMEGAIGKQLGVIPLLSDQNVLDCSGGGSCGGGWTATALNGMIKQGGVDANSAYPYQVAQGTCRYNAASSQGRITISGQTAGDFDSIYNALKKYGPVGIAVFVVDSWYSYSSGVISADYSSVNHAVTIVGYEPSLDAWIVKNSWGGSWGMSGFVYLSAQHPSGANLHGAFWAQ